VGFVEKLNYLEQTAGNRVIYIRYRTCWHAWRSFLGEFYNPGGEDQSPYLEPQHFSYDAYRLPSTGEEKSFL